MLHAPTSEKQTKTGQNSRPASLFADGEHLYQVATAGTQPSLHTGGWSSMDSRAAQHRSQWRHIQSTHGNQAILRTLQQQAHGVSTLVAPAQGGLLQRKCACSG